MSRSLKLLIGVIALLSSFKHEDSPALGRGNSALSGSWKKRACAVAQAVFFVAFCKNLWYCFLGAASNTVGGCPLHRGGSFLSPDFGKGGCSMVTYSELFQFCLVIIGIIGLFLAANKKK